MKKLIALLLIISCNSRETNTLSLAPTDFNSKLKDTPGAVLLDVRSESELKEGILTGARNIEFDEHFGDKLGSLSKETPILVYCAKGKRSEKAATIMKEKGFKEVYQLAGGLDAWREANLPIQKLH